MRKEYKYLLLFSALTLSKYSLDALSILRYTCKQLQWNLSLTKCQGTSGMFRCYVDVSSIHFKRSGWRILFMWLNYNLGKVNLDTMLAGQLLSPRQAGSCGMAAGSAGAYMWLYISVRLCFALLCFADLCGSLLFTTRDICFCSHSSHPWIGRYGLW